LIGVIISRKLATLYELQTIYGIIDAQDLFEVIRVDNYNESKLTRDANV